MKQIGYIGLGIMGAPMARNLIEAGYSLTVWNRTASKAQPLLDAGAQWADSPAEVAEKVQAVCVNVTDTPDVEQVIFGKNGVLAGNPGDTAEFTIIDHSTISPAATREFAEKLTDHGVDMLDAPVSGGDTGAINGTLSIMVGGEQAVFDRCKPIFETVGKSIMLMGPNGAGQATKACNQILCAMNLLAACEAMALARSEELDVARMIKATSAGAGGSWQLANLGPKIAEGDMAPGFMVDLLMKDLGIVQGEAKRLNLPMLGTDTATNLFRAVQRAGFGREGTQALSRAIEMLSGLKYRD